MDLHLPLVVLVFVLQLEFLELQQEQVLQQELLVQVPLQLLEMVLFLLLEQDFLQLV